MSIYAHDDYAREARFETDVLVIGTGAGGAAVGAELAKAGVDVLFAEEGSYTPTASFTPYGSESIPRLYRDGGATVILGMPTIPFVEGRTVGGSTVLNGGMTYRPPERVLDEWEQITGDPSMGASGMEALFEGVEERVVRAASTLSASETTTASWRRARRSSVGTWRSTSGTRTPAWARTTASSVAPRAPSSRR